MIGLLQRVSQAQITSFGKVIASIGRGLVVLVGIERADADAHATRLADRLVGYRVFPDDAGKMNLSVQEIDGGLLLVPNFTLAADTSRGMRASFVSAATPQQAEQLFNLLVAQTRTRHADVQSGMFGADMQVNLTNDGPVTFWLRVT
jgi:D-tyrosyl-tRNA(Tyr) deacylase